MTAPRREGMSAELRYWKDRADERALRVIELQEEIKQALAIVEAAVMMSAVLETWKCRYTKEWSCDVHPRKPQCDICTARAAFRKAADDGVKP